MVGGPVAAVPISIDVPPSPVPPEPSNWHTVAAALFLTCIFAGLFSPTCRDASLGTLLVIVAAYLSTVLPFPTTPLFWHGPIVTSLTLAGYFYYNALWQWWWGGV